MYNCQRGRSARRGWIIGKSQSPLVNLSSDAGSYATRLLLLLKTIIFLISACFFAIFRFVSSWSKPGNQQVGREVAAPGDHKPGEALDNGFVFLAAQTGASVFRETVDLWKNLQNNTLPKLSPPCAVFVDGQPVCAQTVNGVENRARRARERPPIQRGTTPVPPGASFTQKRTPEAS